MSTTNRYTQGIRDRAVQMVLDHDREYDSQWAAIKLIAEKIAPVVSVRGAVKITSEVISAPL